MLQGNLAVMYRDDPNVYVAADHLIYTVEGDPKIRQAPDTYVAFGRPKGDRGSYKVWLEGGIFPQVVFEVLAPGNRAGEMARKFAFYDRYGAEEYYIIDPDRNRVTGCLRGPDGLSDIENMEGWVSPRLGIRFATVESELVIYRPDTERFLTFMEMAWRGWRKSSASSESIRIRSEVR
jgi:Uma2 family endonuclease